MYTHTPAVGPRVGVTFVDLLALCWPALACAGAGAGLCWSGLVCAGLVCAGLGLGTIVHTVYRIGYCIYGIRYPNSL